MQARELITQGINPIDRLRESKNPKDESRFFESVAMRWWEMQKSSWSEEHARKIKEVWIARDCKQILKINIDEIDTGHVAEICRALIGKA